MKYLKWVILAIIDILFNAICYVTNPFVLLFADELGNLPAIFKWWEKLHTISKASNYTASNGDLGSQNTFYNCTALKEIHFVSANQTAIESSTGYATKWGAPSSCTIYFDL